MLELAESGLIYAKKVGTLYLYAPSESQFCDMWDEALDLSVGVLEKSFPEPAARLVRFIAFRAKQQKWNLDRSFVSTLVGYLPPERMAGCLLACSGTEHPYTCLFAAKWADVAREAMIFAVHRMEMAGAVGVDDFDAFSRKYEISQRDWAAFFLKHLNYLGWGNIRDASLLEIH